MPLFEIKLEISPEQKELLITQLSLKYLRTYTDSDTYLKTPPDRPKEKIKWLGDTIKRYTITIEDKVFIINGELLTQSVADVLMRGREVLTVLRRTKEEYFWPELGINVAFDSIDDLERRLFFEVYSENRALLEKALQGLIALGYSAWVGQTYDELVKG